MLSQQKSRGCQQRSRGCTARTSPLNLNYLCPMSWLSIPPDHLDPGMILVKRSERCGTHLNPTIPHKHPWQHLMNGSVDQGKHPLNSSIKIMYRNHSNNVIVIYHCLSRIWFFYLSLVLKLFNVCQVCWTNPPITSDITKASRCWKHRRGDLECCRQRLWPRHHGVHRDSEWGEVEKTSINFRWIL